MTTVQQKKDAIHESGHALIVKLFEDEYEFQSISLKPEIYSKQTDISNMNGAIHIKPKLS